MQEKKEEQTALPIVEGELADEALENVSGGTGTGGQAILDLNSQVEMISNIMKTKHDTVKNSISNIM
ncbi:MAG: hypothetical protein HXX08_18970 [Chloroflexi bacterium]|uniref:Uncharacterized protein n=1 Tax=Candidatus Chlorohelix allophototropha TaxID=3003348 RepID=A0A8T7M7B7_9CHLR|nr:hypothetical protein [Chloroflexota bacterium]WJW69846.1 hypothetical protein OZ401_003476 [Chloroflexota bacterium L227-S17]